MPLSRLRISEGLYMRTHTYKISALWWSPLMHEHSKRKIWWHFWPREFFTFMKSGCTLLSQIQYPNITNVRPGWSFHTKSSKNVLDIFTIFAWIPPYSDPFQTLLWVSELWSSNSLHLNQGLIWGFQTFCNSLVVAPRDFLPTISNIVGCF